MIVSMSLITSTTSDTKNNKIELYLHLKKTLDKDDLNLARLKKIKNSVPSALWSIHDSSQNPVTTYSNCDFRGFAKIVFPTVLWCFHMFSQTQFMTPKLSKIGCFTGINPKLSKQS